MLQKIQEEELSAPIVVGGGIVNAAGASAVAAAGADGVFVGTRFLVTEESPMHPDVKKALLEMKAADMLEENLGYAWNHTNDHPKVREIIERGLAGEDLAKIATEADHTYLQCMRLGDMENWYISVDDSVDAITEITTCKQVVDELGDAVLAMQAKMA